jgi:beta-glucosidase-like glycosyl hydrolase
MIIFLLLLIFSSSISATWAEKTLEQLSLREKIGQLFIVAAVANEHILSYTYYFADPYRVEKAYIDMLITDYGIGGIIYLGNCTIRDQITVTNDFQQLSKIPLLIAQDCEWGLNMRIKEVPPFPKQSKLGTLNDPALIYEVGYRIGRQCKLMGVHLNLAPVADLSNNPLNNVTNARSFGKDKEKVAYYCSLMNQGMRDAGILTCAKHFPGHGDTSVDSHHDLPIIKHNFNHINEYELFPFKRLIADNIQCIMIAHLEVPALEPDPGIPASLSKKIISFLKNELQFNGIIITDGLGMGALTKKYAPGEIELKALLTGNDILLCPLDVPKAVLLIEQAINNNLLSEDELNTRVLKILKFKESAGLSIRPKIIDLEYVLKNLKPQLN